MLEGILAYIGIGSNLGDPLLHCKESISRLTRLPGICIERTSSFYKTEPVVSDLCFGDDRARIESQPWFVNAVTEVRTTLTPRDLLRFLQEIESKMGRVRSFVGAPRTIDLDLLLYGHEIIHDDDLTVPHPEMHKRLFVLEPLCEIASYAIHPVFGVSVRGLKDRLNDRKSVEII